MIHQCDRTDKEKVTEIVREKLYRLSDRIAETYDGRVGALLTDHNDDVTKKYYVTAGAHHSQIACIGCFQTQ